MDNTSTSGHGSLRRFETLALERFVRDVFIACGLSEDAAIQSAAVLVAADVRGIPSHGIGRLRRYVNGLTSGLMRADAKPEVVAETGSTLIIDACGGMGAPASVQAMERIIAKGAATGVAVGCVKNSNHFGIAAYYAMQALEHDMIGIAATNTAALGLPTFGRQVMFGTNPLAFAAPALAEKAFVLDMSTTVVTQGKLEVYDRLQQPLPAGWAAGSDGQGTSDAHAVLDNLLYRRGGGILPLGGDGDVSAGYKGYGLAVMVDILCSLLCGAPFGPQLRDTPTSFVRVSHFFGAIKINAFREPVEFRKDMDRMLRDLRGCPPAVGSERVYFAGQKEFEHEDEVRRLGVPLFPETVTVLEDISRQMSVSLPKPIE
jgi:LDH2 family malate/lactate/ureidoglycolate dehydrogenase